MIIIAHEVIPIVALDPARRGSFFKMHLAAHFDQDRRELGEQSVTSNRPCADAFDFDTSDISANCLDYYYENTKAVATG